MIYVNTAEFDQALKEIQKEVPYTLKQIMAQQMTLWSRDIIAKVASDPTLGIAEQKELGRAAIRREFL